jgi:hypothetical protein
MFCEVGLPFLVNAVIAEHRYLLRLLRIDLRVILGDDSDTVQQYLLEHLRNYNLEHLQTICLPGTNEQVRTAPD